MARDMLLGVRYVEFGESPSGFCCREDRRSACSFSRLSCAGNGPADADCTGVLAAAAEPAGPSGAADAAGWACPGLAAPKPLKGFAASVACAT